ncbi:hypothetical protein SAE02_50300 [Skermanella aerolata]|uniref:TIR domain-containing protein n=1 Tax=Skermanella aerolata TaxID=393310 RepID=A0A512DWN9_9PROT|nr:toll/interleukin-1 receptor domain-containing protein [Skermanella aerolata]KJB93685.1 hypothetical protein N826_14100 [Skermanella aerolata KACC 11604]GEO40882.1 hypothetical protein SAE02_50300 [Skermanella aerolata]
MTLVPPHRTKLFISYSHQDQVWLDRLKRHLKPSIRNGNLDAWDDTRIRPGQQWKQEIRDALDAARVAVLLISVDFFDSDFIATNELPPLLAAAREQGVVILPLIVTVSRFTREPELCCFQAVNSPDRPLDKMDGPDQETLLNRLAEQIETLCSP